MTLSSPTISTYEESAMRNNEVLINRLKEQGIPYITHDNIIHKHLYRDSLNSNSVPFFRSHWKVSVLYSGKLTSDWNSKPTQK